MTEYRVFEKNTFTDLEKDSSQVNSSRAKKSTPADHNKILREEIERIGIECRDKALDQINFSKGNDNVTKMFLNKVNIYNHINNLRREGITSLKSLWEIYGEDKSIVFDASDKELSYIWSMTVVDLCENHRYNCCDEYNYYANKCISGNICSISFTREL